MTERRARRKPGENRGHLLEAGLVEFGLFGYHGASTAAIATRAEVPQPHVYASFGSKQELFLACCTAAFDALLAASQNPAAASSPSSPSTLRESQERHLRMLYQAIASSSDPALERALKPRLRALRDDLGRSRFGELLAKAGAALL